MAIGLLVLVAGLTVRLWLNPLQVADPQPSHPIRPGELADRIDPNTADWPDLAALPGIGEARARDIIGYREQFKMRHPGEPAFARPQDLLKIKGFGVAMLESLEPHLLFPPPTMSTTSPVP
jgi:DNA uptake protein ComE-like DNA-binding protein